MKNYLNTGAVLIILTLLIPQVSFAAWWNPISWFSGWSFRDKNEASKTEVLEKQINELQSKISAMESNFATSSVATTTVRSATSSSEAIRVNTPRKIEVKVAPVLPLAQDVVSNVVPVKDYEKIYSDISQKFFDLRYELRDEKEELGDDAVSTDAEDEYRAYLTDSIRMLSDDIDDLVRIGYKNPKPQDKVDGYVLKYAKYKADYNLRYEEFKTDDADERIAERAETSNRKNSPECASATKAKSSLDQEEALIKSSYQKKIKQAETNSNGTFGGALAQTVSNLNSAMYSDLADLAIKQMSVNSEYYAACEGYYMIPAYNPPTKTYCTKYGDQMNCTTY